MMRYPGKLPAGWVYHRPVLSADIFATAAALAGAAAPKALDGVDLMPYLTGGNAGDPHPVLYWRQGHRTAIRVGDWKLLRHGRKQPGPWELYDLGSDLSEQRNLADGIPEKVSELEKAWSALDAQMSEPAFR